MNGSPTTDHPVVVLIVKYQEARNERHINQAAKRLTGGIENPWLYLEKS